MARDTGEPSYAANRLTLALARNCLLKLIRSKPHPPAIKLGVWLIGEGVKLVVLQGKPKMYDSPKAAHFDAYHNGKLLAFNDPVGLQYRWAAADRIARDVTTDVRPCHEQAIAKCVAGLFTDTPIRVKLRKESI